MTSRDYDVIIVTSQSKSSHSETRTRGVWTQAHTIVQRKRCVKSGQSAKNSGRRSIWCDSSPTKIRHFSWRQQCHSGFAAYSLK